MKYFRVLVRNSHDDPYHESAFAIGKTPTREEFIKIANSYGYSDDLYWVNEIPDEQTFNNLSRSYRVIS